MKKKVFSLVLVLCMLVSMIPNTAFADDLEWGEVRVYSYYSDIGFVWGYAGADPVGEPETEIAEEKDGYTFQGWYRVTALDESGIATAYGELLCATPTYNYTMEKYLAMVAVYERTTMSPNALKLTAHYQDRNGNTIREDGDVQFGDYTVECQDIAPTIDGYKYLYKQIAGGASGYTFYHVKKDAADSPWNPSYYGITGDGQSVILTEPVEITYYYYVPSSPAGYPTAYYQDENGKELHASKTLSLDEDGGIWLTEPVGEYDSYKVLAPSIDSYTIKEIRVADGQGFTNLADTEHGLHLKGWDDYYGEWVFHSSDGEVTAAHGTPIFTYIYTADAQAPHEHSWDDGVVQKAATAEETGIMLYTCTVCGETKTEETPKLEIEVLSGKCGDNVLLVFEDGTLTIFGSGDMYGPDYELVPWYSFRDNIRHVLMESEVTSVGNNAFYDCENLVDVSISGPVTSFGNYAFYNCKSLSYVSIPETLTSVGTMAFNYCENLNNITLPATMSEIGWDVFTDCKKLTRFVIPNGLTQTPQGLLKGCSGLTEIVIPENVTYIGPMAFAGCSTLEEIILPSGIMDVQSHLFEGCSSLKNISIPENVGSIGPNAFYNCTSLTYVVIPKSVNRVYNNAFENCSALKEVYYGGSADDWDALTVETHNDDLINAYIHYNSAGPESDGKSGVCGENLTWRLDDEGVLTISGIGRMYDYSDAVDSGAPWFPVKDQIKKVVLGEGVLSIGDYAFDRCENLSSVNSPDNLTSIGRGAFNRCTSLRSIGFKTGLAEIGIGAFSDCSKFVWIALPDDLIAIMDSAFFNCDRLTDVYFASSEVKWNEIVIRPGNDRLNIAKIHYESYGPEPTRLDILLQGSSVEYNRELATIAAELSLATYEVSSSDSGVVKYLKEFGFSPLHIYSNNYAGSLAYTVATKPYFGDDADSNTDILIVVAQGSTSPYEFIQDAVSVLGESINGYQAYNIVIDFYKDIFAGIDKLVQPGREYKVLITGHSLGGAAANLVAAKLTTSYYGKANVYCYTFGAIDSIKVDCPVSYGYENIHNVYNKLDTFSPFQRGKNLLSGMGSMYGKFGHLDLFIHDYRTAEEAHYTAIDDMLAHVNHDMDKYLNAVQNGEIEAFRARLGKQYTVCACPVNVEVYKNGELVGRVLNNAVDASVTTIDIVTVSGVKFIYYPDDAQYELRINAFDEGSMLFQTYDPSSGMVKTISDVQLYPGKEMYSRIGGEVEVPQISLYVLGGNDTPIREVHEDGTETAITHIHEWDGGVITTAPTCTEDGVRTYTCTICGETKAEALPSIDHSWDAGTVTKAATCTETGVMTYTCTACGINGTTEVPALGHHYEGGVCKNCGEAQPGFAPKIIEGSGGTAHYGSDYSFRSDAAFNTFLAVYVDGAELSATNYTAKEGSTIITLKGSYIKTLAAGTHTIRIASTLGNADGTFKVSESPKTGDTSDLFKWSFLAIDSFVCLGCLWGLYLLASKKRRAYDPRH